ncbi:MAG: hypothetical protein OEY87_07750 [Gammaproteobacteria bacterium]|nr:hypothetical protein [Gammaproteobacteria bacterium]
MPINQEVHKLENAEKVNNITTVPMGYYEINQQDEINLVLFCCCALCSVWVMR